MFLFMKKRTHIRRESFSSYVGPLLCLRHVSKGEPLKARRKTVREYRQAHRTRLALVAGQFVRAALYLCGLPRIRSPAPRRDVVRPLEKEPVAGAGRRSVCNSLRTSNER